MPAEEKMLLVVDIGNTHVVLGLFAGERLRCHWRIKTDREHTADELAVTVTALMELEGVTWAGVKGAIVSCVVPPMQPAWVKLFRRRAGFDPLLVHGQRLQTGMEILMDNPEEVGADRIVNAVAAYAQCKSSAIVVDFGTATTFDCVSASGAYVGGAIVPGIGISLDALSRRTAKLPHVDISTPPPKVIGTNTVAAIKSGVLFGYASLVDGLVARIKNELHAAPIRVLATGGMAELIAPYASSIETVAPFLTLDGLRLLYERNA